MGFEAAFMGTLLYEDEIRSVEGYRGRQGRPPGSYVSIFLCFQARTPLTTSNRNDGSLVQAGGFCVRVGRLGSERSGVSHAGVSR